MLTHRPANLTYDRAFLLELHCLAAYNNDPEWFRLDSFEAYRDEWLATSQPADFMEQLRLSLADSRTVAEIWQEDGRDIGFLWLTFGEIEGYGLLVAEVEDIEVVEDVQKRSVGAAMLAHAETLATENGAHMLRAETGAENEPGQSLLENGGFDLARYRYEKVLQWPEDNVDDALS